MDDLRAAHIGSPLVEDKKVPITKETAGCNGDSNGLNGNKLGFITSFRVYDDDFGCALGSVDRCIADKRLGMYNYTVETISLLMLPMVSTE